MPLPIWRAISSRGLWPITGRILHATTLPLSSSAGNSIRLPRVILVPGLGLFGLGRSAKDAAIAADLAESWVATVTDAEAVGRFESLSEAELFEMEYWSLEQAKLGGAVEKPLAGQIAVITGGAGTIGSATARALKGEGAEIALVDRAGSGVEEAAKKLGGIGIAADITDPGAVREAFDLVATRIGGVDIVVSNAGAAWQGKIGEVDPRILRDSFALNFWGASMGRTERGAHHAGAAHRRVSAVQRLETGPEPRRRFRAIRYSRRPRRWR